MIVCNYAYLTSLDYVFGVDRHFIFRPSILSYYRMMNVISRPLKFVLQDARLFLFVSGVWVTCYTYSHRHAIVMMFASTPLGYL